MTDLVLIHPGAVHGIYGSDLADSLVAVEPPLWCRLIASYVIDHGYNVKIIDQEAEQITAEQVAKTALEETPKLIALVVFGHQPSASTQQMVGARAIAQALRDMGTPPVIIVGGHVSALPERTLREEPVDFACKGEGPVTIVRLLNALSDYHFIEWPKIPGLVWREKGAITVNKPAELIPMNQLHGDAWNLLPIRKYRAHNWQCFDNLKSRQPYASIMTSLNCPYACQFCCISSPFGNHQYRIRDPKDVVEEITHLYYDYNVRTIKIIDEMFVLNYRHVDEVCSLLIKRQLPESLNIWAYARVDTIKSDEQLAKLRAAGFRWLALGIESGSKHVRDGAEKRLKTDDIVGAVRRVQSHGINVIGNFIVGLPDDTEETVEETYQLACELSCEFINVYSAMAYPGSALYTQSSSASSDWRTYSQHNKYSHPMATEALSSADVLRLRDDFFQRYFIRPEYLSMIQQKFGPEAVEHIKQMTTYKLPRNLLEDK